jgi:outer membrane receptor protein involved in Fe transport
MASHYQKSHSHHVVRSRTSAALSAAIALVLSAAATAADGFDSKVEEVMVTASRVARPLSTIPNTVTVVTTAELDAQLAVHNDISTVLGNLIPRILLIPASASAAASRST